MRLSPGQRQYVLIGQCLIPIAFNFVLNGILGLVMFGGVDPVPTWGVESSAGPDLIGTCFFLPLITCLIVTPLVRRHVRGGAADPIASPEELPRWLRPFRRPLAARAVLFGVAGLALIGSAVAGVLLWVAPLEFALTPFLWIKATFSGVLGGVVTPAIGIVALAETGPRTQAV
jgi:hypothetical protein